MASHPNLSSLRAFEAAARHASFARAAEELGLSAAAISAQIRKLETEMGVTLFHRGHRAVSLTEQGEAYAHRVIDAFAMLDPTDTLATSVEPRVTIELDAEFCRQWLLPRLTPEVLNDMGVHLNLRTHTGTPRSLPSETDIALLWGAMDFQGYKRSTFLRPKVFAVASPTLNASSLTEAAHHRLLHERDDTWWRALFDAASIPYPNRARHLTFHRCDLPIEAAAQGLGAAVGDDISAERYLAERRLIRLPGPILESRDYHMLVKRGHATGPMPRLVAWLKSEARAFETQVQKLLPG